MLKVIFEAHSTSEDNEAGLSSGWNDAKLSNLGESQSRELGKRYKQNPPDAIFCSDLSRAYSTATIAFYDDAHELDPRKIFVDWRLRECDYGDLTRHPSDEVEAEKSNRIAKPFPNGESYEQCAVRMKSFLKDLIKNYDGKTVMIIGHRATQYGLEHWINGKTLRELVTAPFKWQPGWTYQMEKLID